MLLADLPKGNVFRCDGFEFFRCDGDLTIPERQVSCAKLFKFVPCDLDKFVQPVSAAGAYKGPDMKSEQPEKVLSDVDAGMVVRSTNGVIADLVTTRAICTTGRMCGEVTVHVALSKGEDVEDLGPVADYFGPEHAEQEYEAKAG